METANVKVKKWGNSLGVILPAEIVRAKNLKEGTELEILINPKNKTKVKDIFGILKGKLKRDTEEIMKDVDKELWGIKK